MSEIRKPSDDWKNYLRARDLDQLLGTPPEPVSGPVLEIGCGDGYLSRELARRFDDVVALDIDPRGTAGPLIQARAEDLPVPGDTFGFIVSSNVLEHVTGLERALDELRRVLHPDGIMVHTMPTGIWKLLQLLGHPIHRARQVGRRLRGSETGDGTGTDRDDEGGWPGWRRALSPAIHGTSASHLEEFQVFRPRRWIETFRRNGFDVLRIDDLFLHSPYRFLPYKALHLRSRLSNLGLSSVKAYWVRP